MKISMEGGAAMHPLNQPPRQAVRFLQNVFLYFVSSATPFAAGAGSAPG